MNNISFRYLILPFFLGIFLTFVLLGSLLIVMAEAQEPSVNDPLLKVELVAERLSSPTSMAFVDSENILVLEKNTGNVRLVSNGDLIDEPILKLGVDSTTSTCCRGLLGVATDNRSGNNIIDVFLYFSSASNDDNDEPVLNKVYKYKWKNSELTEPSLLLELPATPGPNHPGGKLVLGEDGSLYTAIGDLNNEGMLQNMPGSHPTDSSVIIKINATDGTAPLDNPFVELNQVYPDSQIDKYYGYGIRNSFGLDIDPVTGYLWQTENGDEDYDEINLVLPGFNSGWIKLMGPMAESDIEKNDLVQLPGSYYGDPVFSWEESLGVTDIEFLKSSRLGSIYEYNIFVGDINYGNLYYFVVNSTRTGIDLDDVDMENSVFKEDENEDHIVFGTDFKGITDIETGPDGLLYVLTFNEEKDGEGKIYRIVPINGIV